MFSTSSDCADPKSDCGVQSDFDLHCPKNIIMTYQQQTAFENIVGKKEIARNEQFIPFPTMFLLHRTVQIQNQTVVFSLILIYTVRKIS